MTVSTTANRISYTGDGATVLFAFPYPVLAASDLKCYLVGALKTLNVDYTVALASDNSSANISFVAPPANGNAIVIFSDPDKQQNTEFPATGEFPSSSVEKALDKLTLLIQRIADLITRSVTQPDSDPSGLSIQLPSASTRANQLLGFDASGNVIASGGSGSVAVSSAMTPVVQASTLALGRTALGLGSAALQNSTDVVQKTGDTMTGNLTVPSVNNGPLAGFRNRVINGSCVVAQRGSVAISNGQALNGGCDRFVINPMSFTSFSGTIFQVSFGGFSSLLAQGVNNCTSTGSGSVTVVHKIEAKNTIDLANQNVTCAITFYQDTGAPLNANLQLYKANSVDNFGGITQIGSTTTLSVPSGVATKVTATFALGANASNGLEIVGTFSGVGAVTNKNFYFGDFQLEPGSVATPTEQRSFAVELALCQRYYEKSFPYATAPAQNSGNTTATNYPQTVVASTSCAYGGIPFQVTKRANPTVTLYNPNAANAQIRNTSVGSDWSATSVVTISERGFVVQGTTSAGSVAGNAAAIHWTADAELT